MSKDNADSEEVTSPSVGPWAIRTHFDPWLRCLYSRAPTQESGEGLGTGGRGGEGERERERERESEGE